MSDFVISGVGEICQGDDIHDRLRILCPLVLARILSRYFPNNQNVQMAASYQAHRDERGKKAKTTIRIL